MQNPYVVIPNWNGAKDLPKCLDSLLRQTVVPQIIVVDNGSKDDSLNLLQNKYPQVNVVALAKNYGFAEGVNIGIRKAMSQNASYVALLNNDAAADKDWVKHLSSLLDKKPDVGIVTGKIYSGNKKIIDTTGDTYTVWGLPFPRGRGEPANAKYDEPEYVFGASGGASMYRVKALEKTGLFDKNFFAYYEDIDISFRMQLAGWKIAYQPKAVAYHQIGATSSKIKGFATYQTLKNLPLLMWKNVPARLMLKVFPRFVFAYFSLWGSALARGQIWPSTKGVGMSILLWPKKLVQRWHIQKNRKVPVTYINSIIVHDLPPNAHKLRSLRVKWWKLQGKNL